jgi:hypothetical protein
MHQGMPVTLRLVEHRFLLWDIPGRCLRTCAALHIGRRALVAKCTVTALSVVLRAHAKVKRW